MDNSWEKGSGSDAYGWPRACSLGPAASGHIVVGNGTTDGAAKIGQACRGPTWYAYLRVSDTVRLAILPRPPAGNTWLPQTGANEPNWSLPKFGVIRSDRLRDVGPIDRKGSELRCYGGFCLSRCWSSRDRLPVSCVFPFRWCCSLNVAFPRGHAIFLRVLAEVTVSGYVRLNHYVIRMA